MATTIDAVAEGDRRAEVQRALVRYPYIEYDELVDLLHWFRKEASALDVGLLVSEPGLAEPYERFKSEHLNRVRGADLFWAAVFMMLFGAIFALMVWSAL